MKRARTQEAKQDRRAVFAAAALDEFYENGFAAARMEDIARRAGFSKGALYLYFDSKDALFEAVIETFAMPNVALLESVAQSAAGVGAVIDGVTSLAPSVIREGRIPKIAKVLIGDAPAFPAVATTYRKKVIDRVLAAITDVLRRAKSTGEIDVGDPALAARLIAAPMIFSAIWRVVFEHDDDARVDLDALFTQHAVMLKRAFKLAGAA